MSPRYRSVAVLVAALVVGVLALGHPHRAAKLVAVLLFAAATGYCVRETVKAPRSP